MLAAVYMQIGHLEIPPCEIEIPKPSYSHVDRMFQGYERQMVVFDSLKVLSFFLQQPGGQMCQSYAE